MTNKKITFTTKQALEYLADRELEYKTNQGLLLLNKRQSGVLGKKVSERKIVWYKEELDKYLDNLDKLLP